LKYVRFCFVDYSILLQYFSNYEIEDIDIDLFYYLIQQFSQLKENFFSENRWNDKVYLLTNEKINQIIQQIGIFLQITKYLQENLRIFVKQHCFHEESISCLEEEICILRNQIHEQTLTILKQQQLLEQILQNKGNLKN
jgi:hypothetical protein